MSKSYLEYYRSATPDQLRNGLQWYIIGRGIVDKLAARFDRSPECVAGIIAALSQRQRWTKNLRLAVQCLRGEYPKTLTQCAKKAVAIRDGADPDTVLGGNKIRAFYRALLGDPDAVVLDSWMIRAISGQKTLTDLQYKKLARRLAANAKRVGLAPAPFQAVVWCAIRGRSF